MVLAAPQTLMPLLAERDELAQSLCLGPMIRGNNLAVQGEPCPLVRENVLQLGDQHVTEPELEIQ
jgi:hypothetical protein